MAGNSPAREKLVEIETIKKIRNNPAKMTVIHERLEVATVLAQHSSMTNSTQSIVCGLQKSGSGRTSSTLKSADLARVRDSVRQSVTISMVGM